ncbi:hypothetical protein [Lysobacter gummosus]|uniref:hypothetical protein n=1 Tax=Lysobacter gummosus TaxID=262324 RepID=UPI003629162E
MVVPTFGSLVASVMSWKREACEEAECTECGLRFVRPAAAAAMTPGHIHMSPQRWTDRPLRVQRRHDAARRRRLHCRNRPGRLLTCANCRSSMPPNSRSPTPRRNTR